MRRHGQGRPCLHGAVPDVPGDRPLHWLQWNGQRPDAVKLWGAGLGGLLVGLAVGGAVGYGVSTEVGQGTTTVIERVTPEPMPTTEPESDPTPTETATEPDAGSESLSELNAEDEFATSPWVEFRGTEQLREPVELAGEEVIDASVVTLDYTTGGPWTMQVPVAGGARFSVAQAGFETTTEVGNDFELSIYADDLDSEPIYGPETFEGPSTLEAIDLDLEGASTLVFEWRNAVSLSRIYGLEAGESRFVLGEARLLD